MTTLFALGLALGPTGAGSALAAFGPVTEDYTVLEDTLLTVDAPGYFGNDIVDTGNVLCPGTLSVALHGAFSFATPGTGAFTYMPDGDYNTDGSDNTFYYEISQAPAGTCPGAPIGVTDHVAVTPVNDPPAIGGAGACVDGQVNVLEDSGAYTGVDACVTLTNLGPSNESGQSFVEWVVQVTSTIGFAASPSIAQDGHLHFTPGANEFGSATVSVQARDNGGTAHGGSDTSVAVEFTINVAPVNDAPSAVADSFQALKDHTLNIAAPGILGNDSDVDQDVLTAVLVTTTVHGALTLAANGSFSYTPQAGYVGPDAFSYRAKDASLQSPTRVVSLTVSAVPTPSPSPTAVPPSSGPSVEPSIDFSPTASIEASSSPEPSSSAASFPTGSAGPSPAIVPSPTPGPGDSSDGGLPSTPVLVLIVVLVLLIGFGAALYLPKWLEAQRTGRPIDDD